jgi:hypothetical protein
VGAKPTVYLETSVVSFLTARPSNNLIVAGKQETTRQWWERRRDRYDLFVSQLVIDESARGDATAASRRVQTIAGIPSLDIDAEVVQITDAIMDSGIIPPKAAPDAGHIAVASRHGMDYLVTWNCAHIANAEILGRISYRVREAGYWLPIVCTPDELFGGANDDG